MNKQQKLEQLHSIIHTLLEIEKEDFELYGGLSFAVDEIECVIGMIKREAENDD